MDSLYKKFFPRCAPLLFSVCGGAQRISPFQFGRVRFNARRKGKHGSFKGAPKDLVEVLSENLRLLIGAG